MYFKRVLLVLCVLLSAVVAVVPIAPVGAEVQSRISVGMATAVEVKSFPSECVSWEQAQLAGYVQAYPRTTNDQFIVNIVLTHNLCEEKIATAVVYLMPTDGGQWPQYLIEKYDFSIRDAGEVIVAFDFGCDPAQFDIVQGTTPDVLNSGFEHQLLLPARLDTALQHFGAEEKCLSPEATTTTMVSEVTTTMAITTTTLGVVEAVTAIFDETTDVEAVLIPAIQQERTSTDQLAYTGSDMILALLGLGLMVGGFGLLLAKHRMA